MLRNEIHKPEKRGCRFGIVVEVNLARVNRVVADDANNVESLSRMWPQTLFHKVRDVGVEVITRLADVYAQCWLST